MAVVQNSSPVVQGLLEENISGDILKLSTSWSFTSSAPPQLNQNLDVAGGIVACSTTTGGRKISIPSSHDLTTSERPFEPFRITDRIYSTRRVTSEMCMRCVPQSPFQGVTATRLQCLLCKYKVRIIVPTRYYP